MCKILCFGSLNIDYVYDVDHFVGSGETLASEGRFVFCGGKGLNQSIALARAGMHTFHAGTIGNDGNILLDILKDNTIDTTHIEVIDSSCGHTIIQRDKHGQNCILLYGGANQKNDTARIHQVISNFAENDFIVLQNEINLIDEIMIQANMKGLKIVFNPSPITEKLLSYPLDLVDYFILNEVEAIQITKMEKNTPPLKLITELNNLFPKAKIVLTLGKNGVCYFDGSLPAPITHGIYDSKVIDSTGAGDTFTGFFISSIAQDKPIEEALRIASIASSIAVSREGAAPSIPTLEEVLSSNMTPIPFKPEFLV